MIETRSRRILVDGSPALIMAGEVHYFRLPRAEWAQRLDLAAELGCTCVASYIPWLFHERLDGQIDVTGWSRPERDVGGFIDLCAERGLMFLARPGPFVMAELKNEGLPYRLYTEHPEIVPVGWDGVAAPSRTVDYLTPSFLAEVERWYAAVMPVLAPRLQPRGGPVVGVQLDNEIGMLAWVTNSPDLTEELVTDFGRWCTDRYGRELADRYPLTQPPRSWPDAVRSPSETWAAALRVDLGHYLRTRFAAYVARLEASARRHGIRDVPLLINVHGTEGGDGVPFAIGVSQLYRSYTGRPGLVAGSDHYLGEISAAVAADLHFIGATMAAVNGADQPLTSLEFEAGTGDYSGGLDALHDPGTVEVKVRLCLAQGHRLINYYLLAGGVNPALEAPVDDGNNRLSFTGQRHGLGAPIDPEGSRGLTFEATARVTRAARVHARWLADHEEEHDDLAVAFWPDAFMTEYHHPTSVVMSEVVDDLRRFRGPGPRKALWRSLLFAGFRFGAVDPTDDTTRIPRTVALAVGRVLDGAVQQRLVHHLGEGGSLLLLGRVPEVDTENRPCTALAEALGVRGGPVHREGSDFFPSIVGYGAAAGMPETRVGWLCELEGVEGRPLFRDVDGRLCGAIVRVGAGSAAVVSAEIPALPEVFASVLAELGCRPGLGLTTSVPGVMATTTRGSLGGRLLHLLNPTAFDARVRLDVGDQTGTVQRPLVLPARSGAMLGLDLPVQGATIVAANAELSAVEEGRLRFDRALGHRTEIHLRTDREVVAEGARYRGDGRWTIDGERAGLEIVLR